jgi:Protein of unknown function (DUF2778)
MYAHVFGESLMEPALVSEAPNWGRMDDRAISAAGLGSSRGVFWFGNAAIAVAAAALVAGVTAWMVDFDSASGVQNPAAANIAASGPSFDDRFGSRAGLAAPINYPPRPVVRSIRSDLEREFDRIESMFVGAPREERAVPLDPVPPSAVAAIPLPRARPAEANRLPRSDPSSAQLDDRTLLQKLADLVPPRPVFASLEPNGGLSTGGLDLPALGFDNFTAVYDISARTVFMPDGSRLEAHSGMGNLMDDPAHVHMRMVGATPPSIYDLKPRERLFHGVQALRMTPAEGGNTLGRSGLLVHSYLMGPNGDSNGCVSIRNYDKFLKAFQNGELKRLVVVTSVNDMASAAPRSASQS